MVTFVFADVFKRIRNEQFNELGEEVAEYIREGGDANTVRSIYFFLPKTGRDVFVKVFDRYRGERLFSSQQTGLRPDKIALIDRLVTEFLPDTPIQGRRRSYYIVCPTGWGKTTLVEGLIHKIRMRTPNARFLFLVSRNTTLLEQTAKRFFFPDLVTSYSGSESWERLNIDNAGVVIASLQSCIENKDNPAIKHECLHPEKFDYIFIDEIHNFIENLGEDYTHFSKRATILGMTATPFQGTIKNEKYVSSMTLDDECLGAPFETVFLIEEIEKGRLCSIDYCMYNARPKENIPVKLDLEGELSFNTAQNRKRSEAAVDLYSNPSEDKYYMKKAIFFCANQRHAMETNLLLRSKGMASECIISDASYGSPSLKDTVQRLKDGQITAITCVNRLTEGFDLPEAQILFLVRPTLSARLYLQQLGRGLRLSTGKNVLHVVDMVENYTVNGGAITALNLPETLLRFEGQLPESTERMKKIVTISKREEQEHPKAPGEIVHTAELREQIIIGAQKVPKFVPDEVDPCMFKPRDAPPEYAEYGVIIGTIGEEGGKKKESVLLSDKGVILGVELKQDFDLTLFTKCYVGKDNRNLVQRVCRRLNFEQLPNDIQSRIRDAISYSIIDYASLYEPYWTKAINKTDLRNLRLHSRAVNAIDEQRRKKPFSNLSEIRIRTGVNIVKTIKEQMQQEIQGTARHYFIVKPIVPIFLKNKFSERRKGNAFPPGIRRFGWRRMNKAERRQERKERRRSRG